MVFVDADTRVPAGYLHKACSILDDEEDVGCITIALDGNMIGSCSLVRYSLIELMGGRIPESARNDTCMHNMIKAAGYKIKSMYYQNDGILLHTSKDDSMRRRMGGSVGIGYASYEAHEPMLLLVYDIFTLIASSHSLLHLAYFVGWVSAFVHRAKRIDRLKKMSHARYNRKCKSLRLKLMRIARKDG